MCGIKLRRRITYVMQSFVNGPIHLCNVAVFSNADIGPRGGEAGYIAIVGPNTWAPIAGMCKHQATVCLSCTESDILALDLVLRPEGIPALGLWQILIENLRSKSGAERSVGVVFKDNEAVCKIRLKNIWLALRHMLRTHRVAID